MTFYKNIQELIDGYFTQTAKVRIDSIITETVIVGLLYNNHAGIYVSLHIIISFCQKHTKAGYTTSF